MNYDLKKLPGFMRRPAKWVYSYVPWYWKYGRTFWETYNFLKGSQWWPREKLEEYQLGQLSRLLAHAYENVPYYRRIFDEAGFKPAGFRGFADLKKLPILTKDAVRNNLKELTAVNIPKNRTAYVNTGGTTGRCLGFYLEKRASSVNLAFEWREWNWMGYRFGDKCLVLRGKVLRDRENNPVLWEYDRSKNYFLLSVYDMAEENLRSYAEKIREFRPKVVRGLPSALVIMARFINENKLQVNPGGGIKAISPSSEMLYPEHREAIEKAFGCPLFDKYGNNEHTGMFGECGKSGGYHDFMEYGYTEILDKEGRQVTAEGGTGEIVSTGFLNYAVPMIRYRTEDMAEFTAHKCGCGRKFPLIKSIKGRLQEQIVAADGSLIPVVTLNLFSDVYSNVKQLQFFQDSREKLVLRLVKKATYTAGDTDRITEEVKKRLKDRIGFGIAFVDSIPLTESGKYRFFVQKLPI